MEEAKAQPQLEDNDQEMEKEQPENSQDDFCEPEADEPNEENE